MHARHQLLPLGPSSWPPRAWALLAPGSSRGWATAASQLVCSSDATQRLRPGIGRSQQAVAWLPLLCVHRARAASHDDARRVSQGYGGCCSANVAPTSLFDPPTVPNPERVPLLVAPGPMTLVIMAMGRLPASPYPAS